MIAPEVLVDINRYQVAKVKEEAWLWALGALLSGLVSALATSVMSSIGAFEALWLGVQLTRAVFAMFLAGRCGFCDRGSIPGLRCKTTDLSHRVESMRSVISDLAPGLLRAIGMIAIAVLLTLVLVVLALLLMETLRNVRVLVQAVHPRGGPLVPGMRPSEHVIVAGYGAAGALSCRTLRSSATAHIVVDRRLSKVVLARRAGSAAVVGDITSIETLQALEVKFGSSGCVGRQ